MAKRGKGGRGLNQARGMGRHEWRQHGKLDKRRKDHEKQFGTDVARYPRPGSSKKG